MDGGASGVEIRKARPEDAGLVADVLGDAFSDDAMMGWMMGDTRHASAVFKELAQRVYLKDGFGHLVGDVAATLWLPAGVEGHLSFLDELAFAAMAFGRAGAGALMRLKQVGDVLTANRPREPHYYLFAVGVRNRSKGKGHGGRVIREGLRRADAEGALAYLENSKARNTPLYQRLGFEITGDLPVPEGAPPLLAMLRMPTREYTA